MFWKKKEYKRKRLILFNVLTNQTSEIIITQDVESQIKSTLAQSHLTVVDEEIIE